jgi:hypothetical protein
LSKSLILGPFLEIACKRAFRLVRGLFGFCVGLSILSFQIAPAWAVEGAVAAGPIGGSDIRSAILPPPGLYGGLVALYNDVTQYNDGSGHAAPGLNAVGLKNYVGGAFFLYVPDMKLFGGRIGLSGFVPADQNCGQLVSALPKHCIAGIGDPYFELSWSRSFGHVRPPSTPGAFPIIQGLVLDVGVGAVLPVGTYNQQTQAMNGVTPGDNTFDLAPSVAVTYTTPPWFADGTEISAKLYWDNYGTNPYTQYQASSLFDVDFAVTEHMGRFQLGPAGFYLFQTGQDRQYGMVVPPDGKRLEYLALGGVLNYDMAEQNAEIRFKANTTALAQNGVVAKLFVVSFAKKFY